MTTEENKPLAYPEYDESGKPNPVRLPATEDSEQWELEIIRDNIEQDPNDPDSPIYKNL